MNVLGLVCSGDLGRQLAVSRRQRVNTSLCVNQRIDLRDRCVRETDESVRKYACSNPLWVFHRGAHDGEAAVRVTNDHHGLCTSLCIQHCDDITCEMLDVEEIRIIAVKLGMAGAADGVGDYEMALLEMRDLLKEAETIAFHAVNEDDARLRPVAECLVVELGACVAHKFS